MPLQAEGEFALVKEQLDKALQLSGQPVKRGTMAHDHDVYMVLTDIAALRRDMTALREYTPRLEELATRDGHRLYLAIAHRAWGVAHRLAGELAEAQARLDQAMELFGELGTRWQIGRTLFELGELDRARSDMKKAREDFEHALAEFEKMKAVPDTERARAALAELKM
jgi:tetratricopeptide (TPR) repeat protein